MLEQAILRSYHQNWASRVAVSPRKIPCWKKKRRASFKASRRRLFNQAKRTGDWESYKTAVTCDNKEIIMAKQSLHEGLLSGNRGCSWEGYSWGSWLVSRTTAWDLLNYLMAHVHNLEKRPWGTKLSSFSSVCWSRNKFEGAAAGKPESTRCLQEGLGSV